MLLALGSFPAAANNSSREESCRDEAGVLSEKTIDFIAERNRYLAANCSGAEIFVMTVRSLDGDTIEHYASAVMRKQQIGSANEKNGVLLLLAIEDNEYTVIPGSGLADILSPAVLTEINACSCQPWFEIGDYDTAVLETVRKLNEAILAGCGQGENGLPNAAGGCACSSCSCRNFGLFSLAACSACVLADLGDSLGGNR